MSYASGFMVGTSIGKAVYDLFHNKKKGGSAFAGAPSMQGGRAADVPRFACVSALPGRRRYRAASLVGNAGLAEFMEKKIGAMTGISSIEVNTVTGSILVYAVSEAALDLLEDFFRSRLFPNAVEGIINAVYDADRKRAPKSDDTTYLKVARATGDFLSRIIKKKSNHLLDLTTVAALFLIIRGLRKTVFMGERPSGPQMLWWALSLLRRE
ncbi:MAG: hypothetical protein SOR58_00220 [Megasphaera massiliensis]|jgi:hypothetical protein|uniref:HMA2 domain-containing protein n=1 Tax=Megasphaera massiliensis TaxID=1232428 RepID=UPI002A76554B|nr:hypothetical protein [Megasphaera massiliensis]MDY2964614.1 hypothetical protein [Megasphaera massiliensis]